MQPSKAEDEVTTTPVPEAKGKAMPPAKSESSFARYSKRALEIKAQEQFYMVFGEEGTENRT